MRDLVSRALRFLAAAIAFPHFFQIFLIRRLILQSLNIVVEDIMGLLYQGTPKQLRPSLVDADD
jgi:hypothetical protein